VIPSELVLLPGLDGTGRRFAELVSALPPTVSLNIVKYPTQEFLSYLELVDFVKARVSSDRPYVVVAESFATPLAATFAATHPQNLAGLVMCVGFVTSPAEKWSWLVKALARPLLFRFPPPRWALKHFLMGENPPRAIEESVRGALRLVNPNVLARRIRAVLGCDARQELARTEIPILYIQAEHDRLAGPQCLEEIRRLRPGTMVVSMPGPHLLIQMEPQKTADAIMRFIHQLPEQ